MDIAELYYEGHFDVIMEYFDVHDIINARDIVKTILYLICLMDFKRFDLINIILSQLRESNNPDYQNVEDLIVIDLLPQCYVDRAEPILARLKTLNTADSDFKVILLYKSILRDINGPTPEIKTRNFLTMCKNLNLDGTRIYSYIEKKIDPNSGTFRDSDFAMKIREMNSFDFIFSDIQDMVSNDIIIKYYGKEDLEIMKFLINLCQNKKYVVDIDDLFNLISISATEKNKVFPFDILPIFLSNIANKVRFLQHYDIAKELYERLKNICSGEEFDLLSYTYLIFIKDGQAIIKWLEKYVLNKITTPSTGLIVDYMVMLVNLREYKKYEEAYHKWNNLILTSSSRTILSLYKSARLRYLLDTQQLDDIQQLDSIPNSNHAPVIFTEIKKYNSKRLYIQKLLGHLKTHGFKIVENYSLDDAAGCFDSDNCLTCSICLDEILDARITLITCLDCKKYVGHALCLAKWLKTNASCPLCRCKK